MRRAMRPLLVVVLFGLLSALGGCGETVEPGETGVVSDWGQVQPWTYAEGFHWVSPFYDVVHMTLRTQTYDMGGVAPADMDFGPEPSVNVLTEDQLAVRMDVSVQFHLERGSAPEVFRLFGPDYAGRLVHPIVRSAIRDAASTFSAMELVDDRARLQIEMEARVEELLHATVIARGLPEGAIVLDNILLRNIDLPDTLEESIANVQRQRQETERALQALETARAEAERAVVVAEAASRVRAIDAEAEASANRMVAASLTPEVIELRRIEATRDLLTNEHTRLVMVPSTGLMLNAPVSLVE
jgi:regulator of protease activity HflC (stomatin/prohibitin superfamily)